MADNSGHSFRPLRADDLDAVVSLDGRIIGNPRRGFFEKRLAAAATPDAFLTIAAEKDGTLAGFAFARIQDGDFGDTRKVAVLDIIGIAPDEQGKGLGLALIDGMEAKMRKRGISVLRTQAEWSNDRVMGFFARSGFALAPRMVVERPTEGRGDEVEISTQQQTFDSDMEDHSDPGGDDFVALSRDRFPVRSLEEGDLPAIIRIDKKLTGADRGGYFQEKMAEVMRESGIRISLIAESDGSSAGYIMARVDYGEFGRTDSAAVIDTIGVDPAYAHQGIGHALMSQLLANLSVLRVDTVRSMVRWNNYGLIGFLENCGFTPSQRVVLTKTIQ
ncbi:MAG: GNAT family N-acetyltransferase [Rhodospirillales bacterium]|nr:GNAT family N-acetyltransferase [Rhodospirillales bacterium]